MRRLTFGVMCVATLAWVHPVLADDRPELAGGKTFSIKFPEMPPTFYAQATKDGKTPMMTVFLPSNYDPQRKHPVLIFLEGQYGGAADGPGRARDLSASKDFICVALPLFKASMQSYLIGDDDCKLMWSPYKKMLAKLTETVPNVDPANRIIGGFSNGANAVGGLIDNSDGEAARYFSAFFLAEGGMHMTRYDLIKGKPLLILHGDQDPDVVLAKYRKHGEDAASAGVKVTMRLMKGVGHGFGPSEYPFVRQWMRETALK
jgi:dienelactone hydrolase